MDQRGGRSLIYAALVENLDKPSYALNWEQDVEVSWEAETWFSTFQQAFKGMVNTTLMEANLKIITRWYMVTEPLVNIFPNTSPLCFRGCNILDTFFQTWWECSRIRGFWNKIFNFLAQSNWSSSTKNTRVGATKKQAIQL